jgi:hypothetical protein
VSEEWAERLRKYLGWADVTRSDLFADDDTRRQLSFHDLRHSGITWRAVRGDEPLKVQRAAGHDDFRTTQRYINEAQTFEGSAFGEPFPAIDLELLTPFPGGRRILCRLSDFWLWKTHGTAIFTRDQGVPSGSRIRDPRANRADSRRFTHERASAS